MEESSVNYLPPPPPPRRFWLQPDREKIIIVLNQKYPPKVIWDSLMYAGYKKSGHLLVGMWINDVIAQN